VLDVLEREIQRREQLAALDDAIGCWNDEDHPELANGSEVFIRKLRDEAVHRSERMQQQVSE
jgi:hypothetical protein